MKKLISIIILGLLLSGNAYAEIVYLRCILDKEFLNQRVEAEVNLEKKVVYLDNFLLEIKSIEDRKIVAKSKDVTLKLDRFDGLLEVEGSKDRFSGYCKKYNRIF